MLSGSPDPAKFAVGRSTPGRVLYGNVVEAENETLVRVDVGAVSVARKYSWGASTPTEIKKVAQCLKK